MHGEMYVPVFPSSSFTFFVFLTSFRLFTIKFRCPPDISSGVALRIDINSSTSMSINICFQFFFILQDGRSWRKRILVSGINELNCWSFYTYNWSGQWSICCLLRTGLGFLCVGYKKQRERLCFWRCSRRTCETLTPSFSFSFENALLETENVFLSIFLFSCGHSLFRF